MSDKEKLIEENQELKKSLLVMHENIQCREVKTSENSSEDVPYKMLNALLEIAKKNKGRKKRGYRYDSELVLKYAALTFLLGGRYSYEIQRDTFGLPSVSTVLKVIREASTPVLEGEFRYTELAAYLKERGLPPVVWISEDGTRIVSRVRYDRASNSIVGFVLPFDDNGCPVKLSFPATSEEVIRKYFQENAKSCYAYVIMAQALSTAEPPFCLAVFGSNNRFTSSQVMARWEWMTEEASKHGIHLLGFSSDADPRLLSAMRQKAFPSSTDDNPLTMNGWYVQEVAQLQSYVQDTHHIGTKLKTRLTKPSIILPMGEVAASSTHLRVLIQDTSKIHHRLTVSDLDTADKMNFKAVEKMTQSNVIELLDKVPQSGGTKAYLQMTKNVLDAFLDKDLTPSERILRMWTSIFFLRLWRLWLVQNKYSATKNFISSFTYYCIELNGHALIAIVIHLRKMNCPQYFIPWIMSSQACENLFRALRSFTTTFSTVVNFDLYELLQKLNRVQWKCDVMFALGDDITFPREQKKKDDATHVRVRAQSLPTDTEILSVVKKARNAAITWAQSLGMEPAFDPDVPPNRLYLGAASEDHEEAASSPETEVRGASEEIDPQLLADLREDLAFSSGELSPTESPLTLQDKSPFVTHTEPNGKVTIVRKSTLCWLLDSNVVRLSSDRLLRVQAKESLPGEVAENQISTVIRKDNVRVGEWCIFKFKTNEIVVGLVLSFATILCQNSTKDKKEKISSYAGLTASTTVSQRERKASKKIGCFCSLFEISKTDLRLLPKCTEVIDVQRYVCSIPRPNPANTELMLHQDVLEKVRNLL